MKFKKVNLNIYVENGHLSVHDSLFGSNNELRLSSPVKVVKIASYCLSTVLVSIAVKLRSPELLFSDFT
jgi:hypothetical protein